MVAVAAENNDFGPEETGLWYKDGYTIFFIACESKFASFWRVEAVSNKPFETKCW